MKYLSTRWCVALAFSVTIGLCVAIAKDPPASAGNEGNSTKTETKVKDVQNTKPAAKAEGKPKADAEVKKPAAADDRSADELAIRLTAETYEQAYANADTKSIVAHYTPDAEYVDEQGDVYQGREAIEQALTALFAENPGCRIELNIETIRFVTPGVAVEDGMSTFTSSESDEPVNSRYTAIHVKTDGKWLTASVREHAPKDRRQHRTQLRQLAWLEGKWVDESDECVVLFNCESVDGGNFLLRNFTIQIAGQAVMSGTQRIGFDPVTGKLRAWIFDSDGGYGDGLWHRDDNRWVLKSIGVTADGQPASSTSIYTLVNEDTMTWQSVDREIAGVALPDSDVVTIVRRAPPPEIVMEASVSKSN